jgi:hypothetical protein
MLLPLIFLPEKSIVISDEYLVIAATKTFAGRI